MNSDSDKEIESLRKEIQGLREKIAYMEGDQAGRRRTLNIVVPILVLIFSVLSLTALATTANRIIDRQITSLLEQKLNSPQFVQQFEDYIFEAENAVKQAQDAVGQARNAEAQSKASATLAAVNAEVASDKAGEAELSAGEAEQSAGDTADKATEVASKATEVQSAIATPTQTASIP